MTPPSPQQLPIELLLEIFIRCAQIHPSPATFHKLSVVNREWRTIFKTYERLLWQMATLSAFPPPNFSSHSASSMVKSRPGSESGCESELDWKETFLIHWGWKVRKGRTTVVVPGPPPPPCPPISGAAVLEVQGPVEESVGEDAVVATTPVVVSIQEALQVQAGAPHGHVHQHHQHHQHHHHHIHDHHFLMGQQQSLDSAHRVSVDADETLSLSPQVTVSHAHAYTAPFLLPSLSSSNNDDILSCSLCTYSDICLIPQAKVCVRTFRMRTGGPLMQVLDWSLRHAVDIGGGSRTSEEDSESESDGEVEAEQDIVEAVEAMGGRDWHQDLISGMAVNERGELLATCSIDGTVRVWDVLVREFGDSQVNKGKGVVREEGEGEGNMEFMERVEKFGCPIRARRLLTGHVGWVNAVAIEDTTVVSGGSDHTVRVWDALSGTLLRLIPFLFTIRDFDLGVFTVDIHTSPSYNDPHQPSTVLGAGSVLEGYQLLDPTTGAVLLELDEPLTSRQHAEFEAETYQQYASKMAITATVVVTNSKVAGMLCVWCRRTGELMYRIRVCGESRSRVGRGGGVREKGEGLMVPMVSCSLSESSRTVQRMQGAEQEEEGETIHTFKVNKSGSMLMCTLCDGRVALFEFGDCRSGTDMVLVEDLIHLGANCREISGAVDDGGSNNNNAHAVAEAHGPGIDVHSGEEGVVVEQQSQPQLEIPAGLGVGEEEEADHACNSLAWIWVRDRQSKQQRVVLV